ncbi:MAG TPA: LPS export ABC transporter periplasmic protein LptC [Cyclobacteriaceae bacterium]|nr:LPS export ABC transporter periplasmic protein LptC [Cyclobacteriaceae bacterium]
MMNSRIYRLPIHASCLLSLFLLCSCTAKEKPKPVIYNGPLRRAENITLHYAEKEKVKVILQAKKVNEFQNGDREFPEGIYLEFFDEMGKMTSTLRANTAYQFKQENKWRGRGNVVVVNLEKEQQLNTEELFWMPLTKKIFTEKFVTITDHQDIIYGTHLKANQDLSNYSLKETSGQMEVKD